MAFVPPPRMMPQGHMPPPLCMAPVPMRWYMSPMGPVAFYYGYPGCPPQQTVFPYAGPEGPEYVSDDEENNDENEHDSTEVEVTTEPQPVVCQPETTTTSASAANGGVLSPSPIIIIHDHKTDNEDKTKDKTKAEQQPTPSSHKLLPPIGAERSCWAVPLKTTTAVQAAAPVKVAPAVQNVVAKGPVEVYPRRKTLAQRIDESDGNNLPELAPCPDLSRCQKCQLRAPHREGMRYCSGCFQTLPFCHNYDECGLRTDNKEHGYCNQCYFKYRQVCVECRTHFYFDESGLCRGCTQKAPPIKRGQCQAWWTEDDETGCTRRMVCGRNCPRGRRFCPACWQTSQ